MFERVVKGSLRELQVLVGHLNLVCRVIALGQAFLRYPCDAMAVIRLPHHRLRVSHEMRDDIHTWLDFLENLNAVSLWRSERLLEAELEVHSDAAGGSGFWVYFRGH